VSASYAAAARRFRGARVGFDSSAGGALGSGQLDVRTISGAVERVLRGGAVGRKHHYGRPLGTRARVAELFYSLIESANSLIVSADGLVR